MKNPYKNINWSKYEANVAKIKNEDLGIASADLSAMEVDGDTGFKRGDPFGYNVLEENSMITTLDYIYSKSDEIDDAEYDKLFDAITKGILSETQIQRLRDLEKKIRKRALKSERKKVKVDFKPAKPFPVANSKATTATLDDDEKDDLRVKLDDIYAQSNAIRKVLRDKILNLIASDTITDKQVKWIEKLHTDVIGAVAIKPNVPAPSPAPSTTPAPTTPAPVAGAPSTDTPSQAPAPPAPAQPAPPVAVADSKSFFNKTANQRALKLTANMIKKLPQFHSQIPTIYASAPEDILFASIAPSSGTPLNNNVYYAGQSAGATPVDVFTLSDVELIFRADATTDNNNSLCTLAVVRDTTRRFMITSPMAHALVRASNNWGANFKLSAEEATILYRLYRTMGAFIPSITTTGKKGKKKTITGITRFNALMNTSKVKELFQIAEGGPTLVNPITGMGMKARADRNKTPMESERPVKKEPPVETPYEIELRKRTRKPKGVVAKVSSKARSTPTGKGLVRRGDTARPDEAPQRKHFVDIGKGERDPDHLINGSKRAGNEIDGVLAKLVP